MILLGIHLFLYFEISLFISPLLWLIFLFLEDNHFSIIFEPTEIKLILSEKKYYLDSSVFINLSVYVNGICEKCVHMHKGYNFFFPDPLGKNCIHVSFIP